MHYDVELVPAVTGSRDTMPTSQFDRVSGLRWIPSVVSGEMIRYSHSPG